MAPSPKDRSSPTLVARKSVKLLQRANGLSPPDVQHITPVQRTGGSREPVVSVPSPFRRAQINGRSNVDQQDKIRYSGHIHCNSTCFIQLMCIPQPNGRNASHFSETNRMCFFRQPQFLDSPPPLNPHLIYSVPPSLPPRQ